MPIVVSVEKANFKLVGPEWFPAGPAWARAREPERRAYRRRLGELAVEAKRRELRKGVGVDGKKFEPRKWPRPDHANGPPLSPHRAQSRFQRLLAFAVNAGGVTLFWRGGWAKVVGAHAFPRNNTWGKPKRPVRDAVGLTPTSETWVREQALLWWANRHPGRPKPPRPEPKPEPKPKPKPVPPPPTPKPKPAPIPAPPPKVGGTVEIEPKAPMPPGTVY